MGAYAPTDPYYDEIVDSRGKVKKVKVGLVLFASIFVLIELVSF